MPDKYRNQTQHVPSGVENRNRALDWILKEVEQTGDDSGVIYFADDDNTYDLRIFEQVSFILFGWGLTHLAPLFSFFNLIATN